MEGIQVSTAVGGSRNQISIIKVGGYIDTTTSSEVERALNGLLKQGRFQIIIDLGNVDYISSAGWGIFISEIKAIRENNGDLKLVKMIPDVYEIFELLEFHHILDVYDSAQEAIHKFEESQFVEAVPDAGVGRPQQPQPADPFKQPEQPPVAPPRETRPPEPQQPAAPQVNRPPIQPEQPQAPQQPAAPQQRSLAELSLEDKIRYIIARNPDMGAYKINKRLNSPDFGYTKVGWFGVRSWLNRLGLNSRKSRRQFAARFRKQ